MRIGRLFGLDIRLDLSWLIIFALVTFTLAELFSSWIAGVAGSLLFFASILIHELSHSLIARAKGIPVRGITLFVFGGVSMLGREPKRAADEFWMAAAGPATSALLGAMFLGLWALTASEMLMWLGRINLALAVFNLLPGFPLDGGRVFRAAAWKLTGNLRKATRWAATAGMAVGFCFMAWGLFLALGPGLLVNGLWIGLIGWFLVSAARSSGVQMEVRELLGKLRADQVLRHVYPRLAPEETVTKVVEDRIYRTGDRSFFVEGESGLAGLVTIKEIKSVPRELWGSTPISRIMIPVEKLKNVQPSDDLASVIEWMDDLSVDMLPVDRVGVVMRQDIMQLLAMNMELGWAKS
jgi:Zn-dependent protease